MRSGADIVGDVEQRRDEQLVGGGAFGLDRLARAAARQPLRHEAALGADRHDHRVLHVLRFDQAQDLGAEILRPVGPADAAARHLAEAQMHAFDPRRIDEDLVQRPRQRHVVELAAGELDRDQLLRLAVAVELIEVGADRGCTALTKRRRMRSSSRLSTACSAVSIAAAMAASSRTLRSVAARRARVETGVEQSDDLRRNAGVLAQRRPHIVLRERHADLAQKARQRADQRDVAPDQPGRQHQRVVAVVLGAARP